MISSDACARMVAACSSRAHVMQEVSALCNSIIVIARGKIVASGTPDELRAQTGHDSLEDAFVTLAGFEQDTEAAV